MNEFFSSKNHKMLKILQHNFTDVPEDNVLWSILDKIKMN